MNTIINHLRKHWFWWVANTLAAYPLLHLLWDAGMGNFSANPVKEITLRTGTPAIITLFLSLACTPAASIFGFRLANTVRKSLGLQSFVYATFHFLTFVGLDYALDLDLILADGIVRKPYAVVGFIAFLILLALTLTSTKASQRWLGRNWKRLHRLAYVAGVLAVIHFFWLARASDGRPLLYGVILTVLLVVRIPTVRSWLVKQRTKIYNPAPPVRKGMKQTVKTVTVPSAE